MDPQDRTLYRFDVEYWEYEQALELPYGYVLPRLVLMGDTRTLDSGIAGEETRTCTWWMGH